MDWHDFAARKVVFAYDLTLLNKRGSVNCLLEQQFDAPFGEKDRNLQHSSNASSSPPSELRQENVCKQLPQKARCETIHVKMLDDEENKRKTLYKINHHRLNTSLLKNMKKQRMYHQKEMLKNLLLQLTKDKM